MSGILWQMEHSVEADVTPEFAWKCRTDIVNWNDRPARFVLEGPFIAGSRGTTLLPEQEPLQWIIREIQPPRSFVIEMELDGAMLTFKWSFDALSEHRTKITQKIVLAGDNAQTYLQQVESGISSSLAEGMRRIAADMAAAERGTDGNH